MHIAHILKSPSTGGIEKLVDDLIPNSGDRKDQYSIIFSKSVKGDLFNNFANKQIGIMSLPVNTIPFRPHRLYRWLKPKIIYTDYLFSLKRINPDIVHSHSTNLVEVIEQMHACLSLGIPYVWTIHIELEDNLGNYLLLQEKIREFLTNSLPVAITYVGSQPPILKKLSIDQTKIPILYIPSGINIADFTIEPKFRNNNRLIFGVKNQDFIIGYVGRLSQEKGVDILLNSAKIVLAHIPNAKFFIVGDGPERTNLETQILEFSEKNRIKFWGLSHNVVEILSTMDLYVQPSRHESFGISVIEAMSAGIPVIGTNVGGLSIIINDGVSGLIVPPENSEALANAIIRLALNCGTRSKFAVAAKSAIVDYDIEKVRGLYIDLYKQLLQISTSG